MKIQISYQGIRLQEHLRALQAAFQEDALGRIIPSPENTIAVESFASDPEVVIGALRKAAQGVGFIVLQDDESFRDLGTRRYQALSLEH